jgi:hypothetical protein
MGLTFDPEEYYLFLEIPPSPAAQAPPNQPLFVSVALLMLLGGFSLLGLEFIAMASGRSRS